MLQGIADEVAIYLCQAIGVGVEHYRLFWNVNLEVDGVGTAELEYLLNVFAYVVEVVERHLHGYLSRFHS